MKKFFAVAMVATMLLSLTACGSNSVKGTCENCEKKATLYEVTITTSAGWTSILGASDSVQTYKFCEDCADAMRIECNKDPNMNCTVKKIEK